MAEVPGATVACPGCGKRYVWKAELAGRKVHCKCGQLMRLPSEPGQPAQALEKRPTDSAAGAKPAAKPPAPPPKSSKISFASDSLAAGDGSADSTGKGKLGDGSNFNLKPTKRHKGEAGGYDLVDSEEEESAATAPASSGGGGGGEGRCSSCGSPVKPGAVICVNCGFNLKSGKKVKTEVSKGDGPTAPATTAAPGVPARPLGGMMATMGAKSSIAAAVEAGEDDAKSSKFIDLYLPLLLIIVGIGFQFIQAYYFSEDDTAAITLVGAAMSVGIQLALMIPLLLVGLIVAAKLLDVAFGPFGLALFKLTAIALGPGALGGILTYMLGGELGAWFAGALLSFVIYWALMTVLFSLEALEALYTIVIISILRDFALTYIMILLASVFEW